MCLPGKPPRFPLLVMAVCHTTPSVSTFTTSSSPSTSSTPSDHVLMAVSIITVVIRSDFIPLIQSWLEPVCEEVLRPNTPQTGCCSQTSPLGGLLVDSVCSETVQKHSNALSTIFNVFWAHKVEYFLLYFPVDIFMYRTVCLWDTHG